MRALLSLALLVWLLAGCTTAPVSERNMFMAGFAKERITPPVGTPMGGYNAPDRLVERVNDDLWARCLVLHVPSGRYVTLVSLDLVGFSRYDVQLIKKMIPNPETTFIFSTHQHSGPDTLGVFGPGRDERYMETIRAKVAGVIRKAKEELEPAKLYTGSVSGRGISMNWKDPDILDADISYLEVWPARRKAPMIAMLVHFACHPEAFGRTSVVSADFPGYICGEIERSGFANGALYANGALGAMVSVNHSAMAVKTPGAEAVAEVGEKILRPIREAHPWSRQELNACRACVSIRTEPLDIPLENKGFAALISAGKVLVNPGNYADGIVKTEVSLVKIGALKILMIPGEMSPVVSRALPKDCLIFGLANDEIGYIVARKDFWDDRFKYERTMSLGPQTEERILSACNKLLAPR